MKKIYFSLLVLLFFSASLHAEELPQIIIVNRTGYTITNVYFSSTADDEWGLDRLAANAIIRNNQSVTFTLSYPINEVNRYDIMVIDGDGDTYTKLNVRVSNNSRIEFTIEDWDDID